MKYTRIKGLGDEPRVPRIGKIHLGIKVKGERGEYPKATDYFVVPPEVAAVFGDTPRQLGVLLPSDNVEEFFPVAMKYYKTIGLWCTGDGETASRLSEDGTGFVERPCPCEFAEDQPGGKPAPCRQVGHLQVVIPEVSIGGIYQIDTGSYGSIRSIYDGVAYAKRLLKHIAWVPFTLTLGPRETIQAGKKKTVHCMSLTLANFAAIKETRARLSELRDLVFGDVAPAARQLEAPAEDTPEDVEESDQPEEISFPAPAAAPAPAGESDPALFPAAERREPATLIATGTIDAVDTHKPRSGPARYGILVGGYWYGTMDRAIGLELHKHKGVKVVLTYQADSLGYRNIVSWVGEPVVEQ